MDLRQLSARPNIGQYKKQAKALLRQLRSGDDAEATARLAQCHPRGGQREGQRQPALADAQLVLAREHGFESWPKFARQVEQLARENGPDFLFESAVDAVVDGNVAALARLLGRDPGLARAASSRVHHGTLLHYVAANGVEDYRQRSPQNAVQVARALLEAGADVNATANMYGQPASVLEMLVSSAHPAAAGVQGELAVLLLDRGAHAGASLMLALAFGYAGTAASIARRTGVDNVVAAAGLGRLDLVEAFVDAEGALRPSVKLAPIPGMPHLPLTPKAQLEQALNLAALLNQPATVEFLLDLGVHPAAPGSQGFTAAHWAAFHGHRDVLRLLLKRNAPLECESVYGATVLATAAWAASRRSDATGVDYAAIVADLLEHGARIEAVSLPCGNAQVDGVLGRFRAAADHE